MRIERKPPMLLPTCGKGRSFEGETAAPRTTRVTPVTGYGGVSPHVATTPSGHTRARIWKRSQFSAFGAGLHRKIFFNPSEETEGVKPVRT